LIDRILGDKLGSSKKTGESNLRWKKHLINIGKKGAALVGEEWIFFLSLFGLILSSLILHRIPKYTLNDFKILITLTIFLIIVKSLEREKIPPYLASKIEKGSYVPLKLLLFTFFISMFITNDVALMVVVPFTLSFNVSHAGLLVALEAMAANGGSALSPFGNPQNLFIYYHYKTSVLAFIKTIFPFWITSLLFLILLFFLKRNLFKISARSEPVSLGKNWKGSVLMFLLFLPVALKAVPFYFCIIPFIYYLIKDRESFKIDYFLIGTFFAFFGFTDNLAYALNFSITEPSKVFLYSAGASQVISNVPAALLFADFTDNWKALLWGTSVGGYGNLIGSLANLIAYKLYVNHRGNNWKVLLLFHVIGYAFFFLGIASFFYFYNFVK